MKQNINKTLFQFLFSQKPFAVADVKGGESFPNIIGTVEFYKMQEGVVVVADVSNLPTTATNIFAFHIHNGTSCENNFDNAGTHYNPANEQHPNHAGDLPPLFANGGRAWLAFFDNRFNLNDVINNVIIIHDNPDDFTTQPSGNSGNKIACGVIKKQA